MKTISFDSTYTRYEKVFNILKDLPKDSLRICPAKSGCACRGCVSAYGISEYELKLYLNKIVE